MMQSPWGTEPVPTVEVRPKTPELAERLRLPFAWLPAREFGAETLKVMHEDGETMVDRAQVEVRSLEG